MSTFKLDLKIFFASLKKAFRNNGPTVGSMEDDPEAYKPSCSIFPVCLVDCGHFGPSYLPQAKLQEAIANTRLFVAVVVSSFANYLRSLLTG